jgi:hypothetical protein
MRGFGFGVGVEHYESWLAAGFCAPWLLMIDYSGDMSTLRTFYPVQMGLISDATVPSSIAIDALGFIYLGGWGLLDNITWYKLFALCVVLPRLALAPTRV